jgi:hypothetical protein
MKVVLIALLIALAISGGANHGNSVSLQRGVKNSLNFACGNQDNSGNWNVNYNDQYTYSCTGQPSWLSWSGSSLSGWVPASWKGSFQIEVSYQGQTSGSNRYTVSCDDNSNNNGGDIWWWSGAVPATWTIACPTITWGSTPAITTPTVTIPQITIPQIVIPGISIPSVPIVTGINPGAVTIPTWSSRYGNWNNNGDSSGNSNTNGNGYNCNNVNWSGSGVVTASGSDYCTLDNGKTIQFTSCSSRNYRSGRKNFSVSDKVNFECWNDGTTIWAKTVSCTN